MILCDKMLGQGQATTLSLNTHKELNVRSVFLKIVLYIAKMVSAVLRYALTAVDTCTQVTITDHNIRGLYYCCCCFLTNKRKPTHFWSQLVFYLWTEAKT